MHATKKHTLHFYTLYYIVVHGDTWMATVSVRLPEDIIEKLQHISEDADRSRSYLIKKAIEHFIEEYADYQIALERMRDISDESISSAEMRKLLDQ